MLNHFWSMFMTTTFFKSLAAAALSCSLLASYSVAGHIKLIKIPDKHDLVPVALELKSGKKIKLYMHSNDHKALSKSSDKLELNAINLLCNSTYKCIGI